MSARGEAEPLPVLQVMLKPLPYGNHSITGLFETVRAAMPPSVRVTAATVPRVSQGWPNRVANVRWMRAHRMPVTHVTGDVTYVAAALPRRGTVITVHDVGWTPRGRLNRAVFDYLWLRMPAARAERVTTVSERVRQDVLAITGCDPAKVEVIPNCVDPAFTPPARFAEPGAAGGGPPTLLQVGTSGNKNIERVAAALEGVDCELHVIGRLGAEQEEALSRRRVRYRASVNLTRAQVVDAYRQAAAVVFVSTFEGFGLPVLEGQATGCPVVTSRIAPMTEFAGDAACLVDPHDVDAIRAGVLRVLGDGEYRGSLRRAGLENARRYSAAAIAARYAALYWAVSGREAPPAAAPTPGAAGAAAGG